MRGSDRCAKQRRAALGRCTLRLGESDDCPNDPLQLIHFSVTDQLRQKNMDDIIWLIKFNDWVQSRITLGSCSLPGRQADRGPLPLGGSGLRPASAELLCVPPPQPAAAAAHWPPWPPPAEHKAAAVSSNAKMPLAVQTVQHPLLTDLVAKPVSSRLKVQRVCSKSSSSNTMLRLGSHERMLDGTWRVAACDIAPAGLHAALLAPPLAPRAAAAP